jgi:hypothetical protein
MEQQKFAIVSPYQGLPLNSVSRLSFSQTARIMPGHRWIFALPQGADTSELRSLRGDIEFRFFPQRYFVSKRAAQLFYMHPTFYENFSEFDYILIHQPDVYVFNDHLAEWVRHMSENSWDYVGAPWLNHQWLNLARNPVARLPWHWMLREKVGSGGFSIRNPRKFAKIAKRHTRLIKRLAAFVPEDIWWCQLAQKVSAPVRRPPARLAAHFAFETECDRCLELTQGVMPFAVHGWNRHDWDFWRERIPGVEAIYNELGTQGVSPI